jgi:RNA polymerase sigma-70 factor (ECF subfamily)
MTKRDEAVAVRTKPATLEVVASADRLVRAFNELRDELVSTLLYVLGNREDAKDAAQEAFIKCWSARDQLPKVLNLRAWIFRVSFNTAKDLQRSAWHRRAKPMNAEQHTMVGKEPAPAATLERKESMEQVKKAVLNLREEEKEVFLLRQNGELTYEEIAQIRNCPVSTVKTQMRSALDKLRKVLT